MTSGAQRAQANAKTLLVALGLALATLWVYRPVGDFGFVSYDDPEYVAENPLVQRGLSREGLYRAFSQPHHGNWHPLTTLSYMLDVELFGVDPGAQHLVNLGLHLLNTLLLFALLLRASGARWRSAGVAALFALHPLHVESVAWISERKDVLSAAFALASAHAYLGYRNAPAPGRYAALLLLFAAGLLCKPMLVTWPFVLLLLDVWPLRRFEVAGQWRPALLEKAPLLLLSGLSSAVTLWAQRLGGAFPSAEFQPLGERVANALVAYGQYLGKSLWPTELAVLYPYPESLPTWQVAASAALLAALSALCLWLRRSRPYALVGWLWFLGTLVPVIGLVPVGAHAYADRYTYLPLIGLSIAVVWGLGDALRAQRRLVPAASALALAALALLAVASTRQVQLWQDSIRLYRHALRVTERNPVMHNNLGIALAAAGRYDEAIQVYREGLALGSGFSQVLGYNAGIAYGRAGRHAEALELFEQVLRDDPQHAEALFYRAESLSALGRLQEARRDLERVVELAPEQAEPQVKLGLVLGRLGAAERARRHFARALELQPLHLEARINLAIAHLQLGEPESAIGELERVLAIQPGHQAALHYLESARRQR